MHISYIMYIHIRLGPAEELTDIRKSFEII